MLSQDLVQGDAQGLIVKARRQSKKGKAIRMLNTIDRMPSPSPPSASGSVSPCAPRAESAEPARSRKPSTEVLRARADLSSETKAVVPLPPDPTVPSLSGLCHAIREAHRRRQDFHRPEKSLTLVIKSIERRYLSALKLQGASGQTSSVARTMPAAAPDLSSDEGHMGYDNLPTDADIAPSAELGEDHVQGDSHFISVDPKLALYVQPLIDSRANLAAQRKEAERKAQKLAKQLPVWSWVESINGFGALGLAQIVGECGDLGNYANPAKVWKRMGLHVVDGKAARKSKAMGDVMGYSPMRRSIMFVIGDSLLKKQNAYRELYLARKVFEQQKVPDGSKMLWHRRAQRYVEKRLLRDLWRAWRDQVGDVEGERA